MKEEKSNWQHEYNKIHELLDINKQSPENYIDLIKIEYLKQWLPNLNATMLEVGAGSGNLITRVGLENASYRIVGLDYVIDSATMIKRNFLKHNLNGTSICADAFKLPFRDNSIDILLSGGLLEHFNIEKIDNIISEMVRVLKPNGLLYADIVPKKFSSCRPVILTDAGGYENNFNKTQWKCILERNGLDVHRIFSGLIIPPNFYNWWRSGLHLSIMYKLRTYLTKLDNTILSGVFGFQYYVFATKRG